jgi:CO/xanthine dehydrogenase FAD-binding subunit
MRTPLSSLTCLRPRTLADALAMLRDEGPLTPLAGCTDVYVNLQLGLTAERRFIDLWPLAELRGITADRRILHIGALTTFAAMVQSSLVRRRAPMLAAAASEIGGRQIQNRATLGGNIANASPAGDSLPVLAVADAAIVLRSARGERRVPFASFYTGYRATVRQPDEIVTAIDIPPIDGVQYWRKVGTRRAQAISKVMCAGVRGPAVRVALGSVAPTVVRLPATEHVLASGGTLAEAQEALLGEIAPIDDVRSTAEYRRAVCASLLADFWASTGRRSRRGRGRQSG